MIDSHAIDDGSPTVYVVWDSIPWLKLWRFIYRAARVFLLCVLMAALFTLQSRNQRPCDVANTDDGVECLRQSELKKCPLLQGNFTCNLVSDIPEAGAGCTLFRDDEKCPAREGGCQQGWVRPNAGPPAGENLSTCRYVWQPEGGSCQNQCYHPSPELPEGGVCSAGECHGRASDCKGRCDSDEACPATGDLFKDWNFPKLAVPNNGCEDDCPFFGCNTPKVTKYGSAIMNSTCTNNRCFYYTSSYMPYRFNLPDIEFIYGFYYFNGTINGFGVNRDNTLDAMNSVLEENNISPDEPQLWTNEVCGSHARAICESRIKPEWRECMSVSYGCYPRMEGSNLTPYSRARGRGNDYAYPETFTGGAQFAPPYFGMVAGCYYTFNCAADNIEATGNVPAVTYLGSYQQTDNGNWGRTAGFSPAPPGSDFPFNPDWYWFLMPSPVPMGEGPYSSFFLNQTIVPYTVIYPVEVNFPSE